MARQHEAGEPPRDVTNSQQQSRVMSKHAAEPKINAPLPRKNTPPCTSKGTAEVCPEEQAPFRRWEECGSCLVAEARPFQQHLSSRAWGRFRDRESGSWSGSGAGAGFEAGAGAGAYNNQHTRRVLRANSRAHCCVNYGLLLLSECRGLQSKGQAWFGNRVDNLVRGQWAAQQNSRDAAIMGMLRCGR
jgi:hypothetical protein